MTRSSVFALGLFLLISSPLNAQVTFERLLNAAEEPHNWLTYSGSYSSNRHSALDQITPANVVDLQLQWVFQARSLENFTATPLVVDGIMYVTQAPNDVVALDAKTGRVFWVYEHVPSQDARPCCGRVNRGVAILGNTLFMATIDARLVAIDAISGQPIWKTAVGDPAKGYAMTLAPLVVKNQVIVGVAGGEFGIRGYIAAYDAATGDEVWRFYTIPEPGEPGHETWGGGDAWRYGGAPVWLTGSYDPELNLTYWGIGNPGPDWNAAQRPGDNLYSDCVVALDADTGELKWYFQFTPNDAYDYDAVQIPVLADVSTDSGGTLKVMFWANRNGFFYALDRTTGQFLRGNPFVKVNWAEGLDDSGRPIQTPQPPGGTTFPGVQGGTNWYSPSYSHSTGLFYLSAWENHGEVIVPSAEPSEHREGQFFLGGRHMPPVPGTAVPALSRPHINTWTEAAGTGAVLALDPRTGEQKWKFEMTDLTSSGILTTAPDLLFTGGREGYFYALNARDGNVLWKTQLGGMIRNGPITYGADGEQFVAVAAGNALFVFGLRD